MKRTKNIQSNVSNENVNSRNFLVSTLQIRTILATFKNDKFKKMPKNCL